MNNEAKQMKNLGCANGWQGNWPPELEACRKMKAAVSTLTTPVIAFPDDSLSLEEDCDEWFLEQYDDWERINVPDVIFNENTLEMDPEALKLAVKLHLTKS